jgi:hypothetical protein
MTWRNDPLELKADILQEPVLLFGHDGKHIDPKAGLALYGPAGHAEGGQVPTSITVGVVGPSRAVETAGRWITTLNSSIEVDKENLRLFPPFPGMEVAFNCRLVVPRNLTHEIPERLLSAALKQSSPKKRVFEISRLYTEGLDVLKGKTGRPDVVLYPWSEEIIERCAGTRSRMRVPGELKRLREELIQQEDVGQTRLMPLDYETQLLLESGRSTYNLHAQQKAEAMAIRLPVQVLEPRTYLGESQKEDPSTPWNLATGIYYKASGIPWRPTDSDFSTCYIGIGFYRDKTSPDARMRTCLAQIFSDLGEGLVLRGSKFRLPTTPRWTPHMDADTVGTLLVDALSLYEKHNKRKPIRIVVHKSSHFNKQETEGANEALQSVESVDLVTINPKPGIQLVRRGSQPPLRGTFVALGKSRFVLYSSGYIPYLRAYPGLRVPRPLLVEHQSGPSGLLRIANEIMKLSKMNWNTARFSCALPSTLMYAGFVKEVMAQVPEEQIVSEDYSSYM